MKKLVLLLILTIVFKLQAQTAVFHAMGQGCFPETYYHEVWAVKMAADRVYIGGLMNKMVNSDGTEVTVNKICWYDWQGNFHPMEGGVAVSWYTGVYAIDMETNGKVWVGGGFYNAVDKDGNPVPDTKYLAVWQNNTWQTPPFVVDGEIYAIYVAPNNDVYVGGDFEHAIQNGNSQLAMGLVRWDGSQIHRVSSGVDVVSSGSDGVRTITMDNQGNLIVGGEFFHAFDDDGNGGGTAVDNTRAIAKLVNNHWQALGNGNHNGVYSLVVDVNNNIYAGHPGSNMLDENGYEVPYTKGVAKWDGFSWQPLGHGIDGVVYALKISGTDLYVGGWFTEVYRADNTIVTDAKYLVKWEMDAQYWQLLVYPPPDSLIRTLDFRDGKMVVGGNYSGVGSVANTYSVSYFTDTENPLTKPTSGLNIKAFLQGPYTNNSMSTNLSGLTSFPKSQPYNTAPWDYYGTESVTTIPANVVDWILVELRTDANTPSNNKRAGFIKNDGWIVDTDGTSALTFEGVSTGNYYIVVYHRNHLAIMSSSTVSVSNEGTVSQTSLINTAIKIGNNNSRNNKSRNKKLN